MPDLKNLPKSPVTGNSKTRVIETFSSFDIIKLYQLQEDLDVEKYFCQEVVYLLECEDTGYRFYYPFEIAADASFYEEYLIKRRKMGLDYDRDWSEDHQFAYQQIKQGEKVLEVGCGTGKFLSQLSSITKNADGLELNPLAGELARKKGFDVKTWLIEDYSNQSPNEYDVICAFQVLEHIVDVKSFLNAALKLLKPNGRLILSVPNNEPYFQRFNRYEVLNLPPHHLGLWNQKVFKQLGNFYDMTLEESQLIGRSKLKADAYLRAKLLTKVKSLPRRHRFVEKLKMISIAPYALALSSLDYFIGKVGFAYTSVVFRKNKVTSLN